MSVFDGSDGVVSGGRSVRSSDRREWRREDVEEEREIGGDAAFMAIAIVQTT